MDSPFLQIAQHLNQACGSYSKAWIDAKVGDDWDEQTVWCEDNGALRQPQIEPAASFSIGRALRGIRKDMLKPGEEAWNLCVFTLQSDGHYTFDVTYPDEA